MATDRTFLIHINESLSRIEDYVGKGRSAFLASTHVQDAVLWNLDVMSRSAQMISDLEKALHPELDWQHVAELCKDLTHDYINIEPEEVWRVVQAELPGLKHQVKSILLATSRRL